jgi:hypothetical protein
VKYMLIMRATDEAYAAFKDVDFNAIIESMGRFNDEMISAGVLVAAEGLDDASQGVVVDYSSEPPSSPTGLTVRPRSCSAASGSSTSPRRKRPSSGPSGHR